MERLDHLRKLFHAYKEFKPVRDIMAEYGKRKGLAQWKYRKEHSEELERYDEFKERYDRLAGADKTFRPKKWQEEIAELEKSVEEYQRSALGSAVSLATAEVILYNQRDLERQVENEEHRREKDRQKDWEQEAGKRQNGTDTENVTDKTSKSMDNTISL